MPSRPPSPPPSPTAAWAKRFAALVAGGTAATDAYYQIRNRVQSWLAKGFPSLADIEDVVAAAMAVVTRDLQTGAVEPANAMARLKAIARNDALDRKRTGRRALGRFAAVATDDDEADDGTDDDRVTEMTSAALAAELAPPDLAAVLEYRAEARRQDRERAERDRPRGVRSSPQIDVGDGVLMDRDDLDRAEQELRDVFEVPLMARRAHRAEMISAVARGAAALADVESRRDEWIALRKRIGQAVHIQRLLGEMSRCARDARREPSGLLVGSPRMHEIVAELQQFAGEPAQEKISPWPDARAVWGPGKVSRADTRRLIHGAMPGLLAGQLGDLSKLVAACTEEELAGEIERLRGEIRAQLPMVNMGKGGPKGDAVGRAIRAYVAEEWHLSERQADALCRRALRIFFPTS